MSSAHGFGCTDVVFRPPPTDVAGAGVAPSGSGPLAVPPSLFGGPSGGTFSSPTAPPTLGGRHVVASFLTPPPAEGSTPVTSCHLAHSVGVSPPSAASLAFLPLASGLLSTSAAAARGPKPPLASASLQPPMFAASPPAPDLLPFMDRGPQEQRLVLSHKHPRFCTCNQQEAA